MPPATTRHHMRGVYAVVLGLTLSLVLVGETGSGIWIRGWFSARTGLQGVAGVVASSIARRGDMRFAVLVLASVTSAVAVALLVAGAFDSEVISPCSGGVGGILSPCIDLSSTQRIVLERDAISGMVVR